MTLTQDAARLAAHMPFSLLDSSAGRGWSRAEVRAYRVSQRYEGALPPIGSVLIAAIAPGVRDYRWRLDGGSAVADDAPRGVSILPPGRALDVAWDLGVETPLQTIHLHLEAGLVFEAAAEAGRDPDRVTLRDDLLAIDDPLLFQFAHELRAVAAEPATPVGRLYAEQAARALAAHLVHHYAEGPARGEVAASRLGPVQLARVRDVVLACPHADLGAMADAAGMPPGAFTFALERTLGVSPAAFADHLRER